MSSKPLKFRLPFYRENQQDIIKNLTKFFEKKENSILVSGTGTGKTLMTLESLINILSNLDLKCICVGWTYKQNERIIKKNLRKIHSFPISKKHFSVINCIFISFLI